MVELIDTQSDRAIGIRVAGKIDKDAIEMIIAEVERKLQRSETLGIYVEVESFGGISLEALWEDLKFAFPNLKHFRKKAVVSDREWMAKLAVLGNKLFPGIEVRHFSFEEKQQALDWARE